MPHLDARFRVRTLTLTIAIVSLSLMAYGTPQGLGKVGGRRPDLS